ncbi:MAG TPA: nitronate monooxygenase [Solirubrobacteraceae bacterium]|nr:nitronate monooxygenase [Solirubrobacteraceae bacterium]
MSLFAALPIVQAPLAGGPSTSALTAAVANAGGYGFVAGGYLSPEALATAIATTRTLTGAPFGVNLFVPSSPGDPDEVARYAAELEPEVERLGVALGEPRWEDDGYETKLEVVEAARVHLASFTFGCPGSEVVDRLHSAGARVAVTVTSVTETGLAEDAGADVLVVQGTEAGGHQASFASLEANRRPLLAALAEIRESTDLPLVATGGVMTGADAAAALGAGAIAVQLGTALLCAHEAGTSAPYREALLDGRYRETIVTRAYTGRFARGLANRFAREHDGGAPQAYPEVHHLTRPLRAAATRTGDTSVPNLWAGTGWRQVTAEPAGVIVRRIADDAG